MRASRRIQLCLLASLAGFGLGVAPGIGCDASAFDGIGFSGGSGGGYGASAGTGGAAVVSPDGGMPMRKTNYAGLCGTGSCNPGTTAACRPNVGTSGVGGASATSGVGGSSATSGSATGGAGGSSSAISTAGAGGAPAIAYGCQVSSDGEHPEAVCSVVGVSAADGPCHAASDCAPGLGCVGSMGDPSIGLCRPYCCGDLEDCAADSYCAPEPMAERADRAIPVCTPRVDCTVLTEGGCSDGQVCTVVRTNGATSCVPKGDGALCGQCPCADGFVCSAMGVCQQLCHTDQSSECGASSQCQGGSANYPAGIGICVGGTADCALQ